MNLKQRLLYLTSTDSLVVFPDNHPGNFTIKLPQTLNLPGKWQCALTEIVFQPRFTSSRPSNLYICCDAVQPSYGSDSLLPILRKVAVSDNLNSKSILIFPQNYYVDISQDELQYITIYIKNQQLEDVSFESQTLTCTLHLQQIQDG